MPQTLLLADDSATIQRVIELTFAGEDIKVVAVSDGDQAIARIEQTPPDIVLADVGMPGKNGYEVAEFVKQTPALAHIPVVLLTGAFEPVDQAKADAVGCAGVLAKPFEPQIVIGRVKELLSKGTGETRASSPEARPASPEPRVTGFEPRAASPAAVPEARVEDYFDRLDAAFASFSSPAASAPALDIALAAPNPAAAEPAPDFAIAEQLAAEPEPEPAPIKVAAFEQAPELVVELNSAPQPPAHAPTPAAVAPQPAAEPRVASPEPRVLPSIADAFSAILAAEQNALGVKPEWPSPSQQPQAMASSPSGPAEIVITDELVDRVARRVLEQMSDRVVRETVAQISSDAAERLVREEIERIKASIK